MLVRSLIIPFFEVAVLESNSVGPFPNGFASFTGEDDGLVVDLGDLAGVGHGEF
jgi:hypothetical protein